MNIIMGCSTGLSMKIGLGTNGATGAIDFVDTVVGGASGEGENGEGTVVVAGCSTGEGVGCEIGCATEVGDGATGTSGDYGVPGCATGYNEGERVTPVNGATDRLTCTRCHWSRDWNSA